mgnify:CR=1 FL=1
MFLLAGIKVQCYNKGSDEKELSTMCNLSTGIYEQGIEQGIETNRTATVLSMLKENLPIEMIARITNLSADKIRALKMENQPS